MRHLVLIGLACLLLAGCSAEQDIYSLRVITDGGHAYNAIHVLDGDMILIGGIVVLGPDAQVDGAVFVLDGTLVVQGTITGNLMVLGGAVTLAPTARIGGDLSQGGGLLDRDPAAQVTGVVGGSEGIRLPGLATTSSRSIPEQLALNAAQIMIVAILAAFLARVRVRPLKRVAQIVTDHAFVAGALGLLGSIVLLALLVLMAFTILLIPVTMLGLVLLLSMVVYGWTACGLATGRWLAGRVDRLRHLPVVGQAVTGTWLFMVGLTLLSYLPLIGPLVLFASVWIGIGAVLLTRFGLRAYVPPADLDEDDLLWEPQEPVNTAP